MGIFHEVFFGIIEGGIRVHDECSKAVMSHQECNGGNSCTNGNSIVGYI